MEVRINAKLLKQYKEEYLKNKYVTSNINIFWQNVQKMVSTFFVKLEFLNQTHEKIVNQRPLMHSTYQKRISKTNKWWISYIYQEDREKKNKKHRLTWLAIMEASFKPELKARTNLTVTGGALDPSTVLTLTCFKLWEYKPNNHT